MTARYAVCSCNRTMPLDAAAGDLIGKALNCETLSVSHQLCRRDLPRYLKSLGAGEEVVVGCTQEQPLFDELARERAPASAVRFVNLRESGGRGREGGTPLPKLAALLAAAALPEPEPVPRIEYRSEGRLLIVGPADRVLSWAERLAPHLAVSALLVERDGRSLPPVRAFPVWSGADVEVDGWLGAFTVRWQQAEAIDLEACIRCDACLAACPEGAIGPDYRIDPERCAGHRDCAAACDAVGAIDFARRDTRREGRFDLVLDLSDCPLVTRHQPPQGYFAPGDDPDRQADDALRLTQLVGRFEKPKYFSYAERLCAHGRNQVTGCSACIEVCSAEAVRPSGDGIAIDPHLCVGCGACTTVCPTGALSYAYLQPAEFARRIRTMLDAYGTAGGGQPAFLLHDDERGAALVSATRRAAQAGKALGLPGRVIPVALHHVASVGLDAWLSVVAFGAANLAILLTGAEAPQYRDALERQRSIAQAILTGLGYRGEHVRLIDAASVNELDAALAALAPGDVPTEPAVFHAGATKRNTLDLAIAHLLRHAPVAIDPLPLPASAPYGGIEVDVSACTLCMACVGACPASALSGDADLPRLRFIERNCVQCGLCERTCPENAIALVPRLHWGDGAKRAVVLNEAEPFHCVRCHKPFGTLQMIQGMLSRLSAHAAFSDHLERLKMCADCRVIDMMESSSRNAANGAEPRT